jgi:hypothetical protein
MTSPIEPPPERKEAIDALIEGLRHTLYANYDRSLGDVLHEIELVAFQLTRSQHRGQYPDFVWMHAMGKATGNGLIRRTGQVDPQLAEEVFQQIAGPRPLEFPLDLDPEEVRKALDEEA